jgi:hypothetical protein
MAKKGLYLKDYFSEFPKRIECENAGDLHTYMRRVITINYPPPGFRFVYIDEVLGNEKFR